MVASDDIAFMRKAIELAKRGRTSPNPHVGAIVVSSDGEVFEGFHARAGAAHAEVAALQQAGEKARDGTLYCTLEPCNHTGRTPPCTQAIIKAGIARVVFGALDPATHGEAGAGVLQRAGVHVEGGVCADETKALVEDFATFVRRRRPFVTWKIASTWNGAIATDQQPVAAQRGERDWISSAVSRRLVHSMRAMSDAVVVGIGTVLADDPQLTVRLVEGISPIRLVCDSSLRIPIASALVASARATRTVIFHHRGHPEKVSALTAAGVETVAFQSSDHVAQISELAAWCVQNDIVRVLLESGATLAHAFAEANALDEIAAFVAPTVFAAGTSSALASALTGGKMPSSARLRFEHAELLEGGDVLLRARVAKSVFGERE